MSTNAILARRRQALIDSGVSPTQADAMIRPVDNLEGATTGNDQGGIIGNDGIALDARRQGLLNAGMEAPRINAAMQSVDAGVYNGMTDAQIKERTDLLRGGGFGAGWDSNYMAGNSAKALSGGGSLRDYGLSVEQVLAKNSLQNSMRPEEYEKLRQMLYGASGQAQPTPTEPPPTVVPSDGDGVDPGGYDPGGVNDDGGIFDLGTDPNTPSDYEQGAGISIFTGTGPITDYSLLFNTAVIGGGAGATIREPR